MEINFREYWRIFRGWNISRQKNNFEQDKVSSRLCGQPSNIRVRGTFYLYHIIYLYYLSIYLEPKTCKTEEHVNVKRCVSWKYSCSQCHSHQKYIILLPIYLIYIYLSIKCNVQAKHPTLQGSPGKPATPMRASVVLSVQCKYRFIFQASSSG